MVSSSGARPPRTGHARRGAPSTRHHSMPAGRSAGQHMCLVPQARASDRRDRRRSHPPRLCLRHSSNAHPRLPPVSSRSVLLAAAGAAEQGRPSRGCPGAERLRVTAGLRLRPLPALTRRSPAPPCGRTVLNLRNAGVHKCMQQGKGAAGAMGSSRWLQRRAEKTLKLV